MAWQEHRASMQRECGRMRAGSRQGEGLTCGSLPSHGAFPLETIIKSSGYVGGGGRERERREERWRGQTRYASVSVCV